MTQAAATRRVSDGLSTLSSTASRVSVRTLSLGAVLAAQGTWLIVLMSRGWYYQDDLSLLMTANGRSPDPAYLGLAVNDHLSPGLRLEFWVLRQVGPLDHPLTVVVRVVLQAVATVLLFRLLELVTAGHRGCLAIVTVYALSPLVVTNLLWLTTALSLLPAQIGAVLFLDLFVRYELTGRRRYAIGSGLSIALAAMFWEEIAVTALLAPIIAVGVTGTGPLRDRVRCSVAGWRGWVAVLGPLAAFVALFVLGGYGQSASVIAPSGFARLVRDGWLRLVGPSMFGGPTRWWATKDVYMSFADPSGWEVVAFQVAFLCVVAVAWRRRGWHSLVGWSLPLVALVVGAALVGSGRYASFGDLVAITPRYWFHVAVPLAVGSAIALFGVVPERIAAWSAHGRLQSMPGSTVDGAATVRGTVITTAAATAVVVVVAAVSSWNFADRWSQNPTRGYLDTLRSALRRAGPNANLYDTPVPRAVLPEFFGPTWHLSDLLPLTGLSTRFQAQGSDPQLVDDDGRIVPAVLVPATELVPAPNECSVVARGQGSWLVRLPKPAPYGEGFLRLDYLQSGSARLNVHVVDTAGVDRMPTTGPSVRLEQPLSNVVLRLPPTSVQAVLISSADPAANVCIGRIVVGAPFRPGG